MDENEAQDMFKSKLKQMEKYDLCDLEIYNIQRQPHLIKHVIESTAKIDKLSFITNI